MHMLMDLVSDAPSRMRTEKRPFDRADWVQRLDELPGDWPSPEKLGLRWRHVCVSWPLVLAGYRLGSDRGSPKDGSTLFSKRVMALIQSPLRVSTYRPVPWRLPSGVRR
jgi:hypothetical protein